MPIFPNFSPSSIDDRIEADVKAKHRFAYDPNLVDDSIRTTYWGDLGSGKTTLLVRLAKRYSIKFPDRPIFANMTLNLPNFKPLTSAKQLFSITYPCFLGMDEFWHLDDSRKRGVINDVWNMLMLRSRKKKWWVVFTEQYHTQIDLRVRFVTDVYGEPVFKSRFRRIVTQYYNKHGVKVRRKICDPKPYFSLFDSEEDPLTLDAKELIEEYEAFLARKKWRGR